MKKKTKYLIIAILSVLLGAGVLSFYFYPAFQFQVCRMWFVISEPDDPQWPNVKSKIPPMFPKWEGDDIDGGPHKNVGWTMPDIVCIVQYLYQGDYHDYTLNYEEIQQLRKKYKYETTSEGDYPFFYYLPVKRYSDPKMIKKIIDRLNSPEQRQNCVLETEDYLLLIEIDRKLNSQLIIRVPYKLAEAGYAITPRGKDKELYEILNSGLKEWEAQKKAEKDRDDTIHRLLRQGIDSPHADYNALFLELKKLDATFGAKDPNELEQRLKAEKEAEHQEQLLREKAKQSNQAIGL
jgi:hypothetical protein